MTTKKTETPWLRTEEGKVRLPVVKHFSFIYPVAAANAVASTHILTGRQRQFVVGEHLLDPDKVEEDAVMLAHPWINEHLADGCIEHPAKTRERVTHESEVAQAEVARRQALLAEANAAVERANIGAERAGAAGDNVQSELDTPLNAPRGKKAPRAEELDKELNTPISKLGKGS